jgi:hypothetical protein
VRLFEIDLILPLNYNHLKKIHMFALKNTRLYLFVIFFPIVSFGYPSRFDLDGIKKGGIITQKVTGDTQKKSQTVHIKKKGRSILSFFVSAKDMVGLSFLFEHIVPRSWKKILGARRAFVVTVLTMITALMNVGLVGYFLIYHRHVLFSFINTNVSLPKPVQCPADIKNDCLVPNIPTEITPEPVLPANKPNDQKLPGEFD